MALPQRSASTETAGHPAPQAHLKLLPKPGRPSFFSPERTAAICALIEQEGISDSAAGALAGVPASTLARWKVEHEGFALELERARAGFEIAQVRAIRQARKRDGSLDWRAAAWLLKHSSPEGYGPASRMRKAKTEALHPDPAGAAGDRQAEPGPRQNRPDTVQSENCAKLPETAPGEVGGGAANGRRGPAESAGSAAPAPQNGANHPETPRGNVREGRSTDPRLSRRERRAEERLLAKAVRVAG